jgi:Zn-finger nucleic acid-binding protein
MGIWFDSKELDKIIGGAKSFEEMAYMAQPLGGNIYCPSCGEKMHYSTVQDVTIDFCKTCEGVWLDTGELSELAAHLPESKLTDMNAPYDIKIKESEGFITKVKGILVRKRNQ